MKKILVAAIFLSAFLCMTTSVYASTASSVTEAAYETWLNQNFGDTINAPVNISDSDENFISALDQSELASRPLLVISETNGIDRRYFRDTIPSDYVFRGSSVLLYVRITAPDGINISPETKLPLNVVIENTTGYMGVPLYANIRWLLPEGISVDGGDEYSVFINQHHCGLGRNIHSIMLNIESVRGALVNAVFELTVPGYPTKIYIPVALICSK